jgi:hypothetical protein
MSEIGLQDLVRNRTMSAAIAATLRTTVREGHSFLVFAVPRNAGKSTTLGAMLAERAAGLPVRTVTGEADEQQLLRRERAGGYLIVPEVLSERSASVPSEYLWGESVRRVFATLASGYSLALTLHAPGVHEAFEVLSRKNAVPDGDASRLRLAVFIRSIGEWEHPEKRRVGEVHEVLRVTGGVPEVRLLHRWDEAEDRFVEVEPARIIGQGRAAGA